MSKTAKYTIILMVATLLSKLLGFAREISLAYKYGAGSVSAAYIVAFSIPTILFAGLGTAILTSYIPMYTKLQKENPTFPKIFTNNVMTVVIILSGFLVALFWFLDGPIVRVFAVGASDETFNLAVQLSRVMILSVVFIGVANILQGYLQIYGNFLLVGLVSIPLNIFVIVTILISNDARYYIMSWGLVAGYAGTMLMFYIGAKQKGFSYNPYLNLRDPYVKQLIVLVIPIFMGRAVMQLNSIIDRTLASTLGDQIVATLSYANRIIGVVNSIFVVSLTTAIFPKMARLNTSKSTQSFKANAMTSVGMTSLIVMPISAGMAILSVPIVQLMFQRGEFIAQDTLITAQAVTFYALGLVFFSIKDVLNNVFYATQDTRTPMINSAIALIMNTGLNLLLIGPMRHMGLALATSLAGVITVILLGISLRRKMGPMGLMRLAKSLFKMLVATGLMSVAVWWLYPIFATLLPDTKGVIVGLALTVLVGMLIYGIALILLRTREMGLLVVGAANMLTRRGSGAKRQET